VTRAVFRVRAVIIDLDGTLLDTAADLAAATNLMRAELGLPPIAEQTVASYVGKGSEVLVHRALSGSMHGRIDDVLHARALASFYRHYTSENGRSARPYPGAREGLAAMRAKGLRLACVTNKPFGFALPLLERCAMCDAFELILGGDSLPKKKPDPLPMLHVARTFGVPADQIVAIGDSLNDAQAARAAGMRVLSVPYGYNEGVDVRSLDVDGIVDSLEEAAQRLELLQT
jgi:phosphoglycolate phosphatase